MDLIEHVYYINLDHRTDRREQIEAELNKFNLPFTRISAIKEKNGHLGCSKSHLLAVNEAIKSGYTSVLICEDDMMWTVLKGKLDSLLTQFKENFPIWDVLMLAINKIETIPTESEGIEKVIEATTCASFLLHRSWMPIWKRLLERSIRGLETDLNPRNCCDQIWRTIQEDSNFYCFTNQIAKQRPSYSDICEGYVTYDC
jgi:GR25 family glycosyltransferase involved in LPS biosynthesis